MQRIATLLVVAACGTPAASPDAAILHDAESDTAPPDAPRCPVPTVVPVGGPELEIANDTGSTLGIFDPSVVYPSGASAGALAYSSVPDQHSIRTRIAMSVDAGATWTQVAEANVPEAATIASSDANECPTGSCSGFLISEVPSLVFDADEPDTTKRWKLFAHRYLAEASNQLHYRIGTITLQTAKDPQGPWSAPTTLIGLDSPSAYTTQGVVFDATTDPITHDCLALTEPGAAWLPGQLALALGCIYLDGATPRIRIVLVRTTDHAQTWHGVSRVLDGADADCLTPGASINAADLFAVNGTVYVAATPSDASYHGCLIYAFDDIASGHLARDAAGKVHPVRAIVPDTGQFSGACTWSEQTGYLLDIGFLATARPFRTYRGGAGP